MTKREQELLEKVKNTKPIYLNPRHKVISGRKGKIMGLEEFKKVWEDFCRKKNKGNEIFWDKHFNKDSKITFSPDKVYEIESGELDCGVPWILFSIQGNTDLPVCLFIYPGEKEKPRIYIPTRGNIVNLDGAASFTTERDGDEYYSAGAIINQSWLWREDYTFLEVSHVAETISKSDQLFQNLLSSVAYNVDWMKEELETRIIGS